MGPAPQNYISTAEIAFAEPEATKPSIQANLSGFGSKTHDNAVLTGTLRGTAADVKKTVPRALNGIAPRNYTTNTMGTHGECSVKIMNGEAERRDRVRAFKGQEEGVSHLSVGRKPKGEFRDNLDMNYHTMKLRS